MNLELNKNYLINSSRKGVFTGNCTHFDDTWASFLITAGRAKAMMEYNEVDKGEEVIVRRSFCTFTEQPQ
jgi:hypothetical protein